MFAFTFARRITRFYPDVNPRPLPFFLTGCAASPMGTNCAPLLADPFLYSYEAEFIQSLLSAGKKRLVSQFNFTYRYIDDVFSINNPDFENYLGQMYPPELEIKDTTESNTFVPTWICSCQSVGTVNFTLPLRQT